MDSALPALLLAVLLTTAGCAGGLGDGDQNLGAAEPTTEPATATGGFPPGLTADGLTDPSALVAAHADALGDRSLTLREHQVRRSADGGDWTRNRTLRTAANRTRFLLVTETDDKPVYGASEGRVAVFADGRRVYQHVETPNASWTEPIRTPSGEDERPRSITLDAARSDDIYVLLNAFALDGSERVRRVDSGAPRYRLESQTLARPDLLASHLDLDTVRNASFSAVVTSAGRVVEYRLAFVATSRGQTVRGTTTVEYASVGDTAVPTPAWDEPTGERTGTTPATTSR